MATPINHDGQLWLKSMFLVPAKRLPSLTQVCAQLQKHYYQPSNVDVPQNIRAFADGLQDIYNQITHTSWLFADSAIQKLAYGKTKSTKITWISPLTGQLLAFSPNEVADILAEMCRMLQVWWNDLDPDLVSYEIETFKESKFGKALKKYGCFVSQRIKQLKATAASNQPAAAPAGQTTSQSTASAVTGQSTATSTPSTPSTPSTGGAMSVVHNGKSRVTGNAKNPYKSLGPLSSQLRGRIGPANSKQSVSTADGYLYTICCKSIQNGKTLCAFVYPVQGHTTIAPAANGGNMIRIGDPSGYSACMLYFKTPGDAQQCWDFITKHHSNYSKYSLMVDSGVAIVPAKIDANGYYEVLLENDQTALIRAHKVNESFEG